MAYIKGRGGKREGAGRKAGISHLTDSQRRRRFQVRLPGYLIEWIRAQPESAGRLVEAGLFSAFGEEIRKMENYN
jgi:hypothetical protein